MRTRRPKGGSVKSFPIRVCRDDKDCPPYIVADLKSYFRCFGELLSEPISEPKSPDTFKDPKYLETVLNGLWNREDFKSSDTLRGVLVSVCELIRTVADEYVEVRIPQEIIDEIPPKDEEYSQSLQDACYFANRYELFGGKDVPIPKEIMKRYS